MPNCIFCKIIKKEIPATVVYEDEKTLAFLDVGPVKPGHTLLIPKEHYSTMMDTPDDLISYLFAKSKKLMKAIKGAMKADFVVISVVGVDVPHFHIHIIPRHYNDGLFNFWPAKEYQEGEIEKVAQKIRSTFPAL